ncbi:hypothetical protein KKG65_00995 [Patescibacteria group bacterium]|nr:hypothetical protein [Patescibacteria group bacterium]
MERKGSDSEAVFDESAEKWLIIVDQKTQLTHIIAALPREIIRMDEEAIPLILKRMRNAEDPHHLYWALPLKKILLNLDRDSEIPPIQNDQPQSTPQKIPQIELSVYSQSKEERFDLKPKHKALLQWANQAGY